MEYAIEVNKLRKEYPGRVALSGVSFKVEKGSIHGLLGPNGAGKTTTMKILAGQLMSTFGEYKVHGVVGFLPENPSLYHTMTVKNYLTFVLSLYKEENQNRVKEVLELCGLLAVQDRLIGNLSKGTKQKVGIASVLVYDPEVIILDEPTVGLDPVAIVEMRSLIMELKKNHTILFSSHQLHEVELLCRDITLIDKGKVLISGNVHDIQRQLTVKKHFKAKIVNWSEFYSEELKKLSFVDHVVLENEAKILSIYLKGKNDLDLETAKLTFFLANPEIGLLDFHEEKMDVEEIFKRITGQEGVVL